MAEGDEHITLQAAAVPLATDGRVCLITSNSGKWIIPKGMIDKGMSAEETALQESLEEAGVSGTLRSEPIGSYRYAKWGLKLEVSVFVLDVDEVRDEWPEMHVRQRRWLPLGEAAEEIENAHVKEMIRKLAS